MMLVHSSKAVVTPPTNYTKTFTQNSNFVIPPGVSALDSIYGHGAPGSPATAGNIVYYMDTITTYTRRDGGPSYVDSSRTYGATGSDYCDPVMPYCDPNTDPNCTVGSTIYSQYQKCYRFGQQDVGGGSPATTGASANGFGKVFYGGVGGTASDSSYTNVPVTAGVSYSLTVPSGASITITYKA